jgi:hypothetical protein
MEISYNLGLEFAGCLTSSSDAQVGQHEVLVFMVALAIEIASLDCGRSTLSKGTKRTVGDTHCID